MPNLDLIKRKVNVREARNIEVFSLNEIMKHFADSEVLIVKQINVAAKLMTLEKTLEAAITENDSDDWLKAWINNRYAGMTLMSYEAFTEVCKLLGLDIKYIANHAFYEKGTKIPTKDKLKTKINGLFERRNQIAHQSDRKRENASREDITKEYVDEKLEDIRKIINAVHICAMQKEHNQDNGI